MPSRDLSASWFLASRLKLRHLQLLAALGERPVLNRAAEQIGLSQPAASKLLVDLERAIRQPLFERMGRGLVANHFGMVLIRHATNILSELEGAREELNAASRGQIGSAAIGSIDAPTTSFLAGAIASLQTTHPLLDIEIRNGSSVFLFDLLSRGIIDVMLGRQVDGFDRKTFSYAELGSETLVIAAHPGHPVLRKGSLGLEDLRVLKWIVQAKGSMMRQRFDELFRDADLDPPAQVVSTDSLLMILAYLARTDAVSLVSEPVAHQQASCGQIAIVPTKLDLKLRPFGVVAPTHRRLSPAVLTVIDALHRTFRETSS